MAAKHTVASLNKRLEALEENCDEQDELMDMLAEKVHSIDMSTPNLILTLGSFAHLVAAMADPSLTEAQRAQRRAELIKFGSTLRESATRVIEQAKAEAEAEEEPETE